MVEISKCLICYCDIDTIKNTHQPNTYDTTNTVNNAIQNQSLISKHLHVLFILKTVFGLPSTQLSEYIRNCPNVEDWIIICDKCDQLIDKCKSVYNLLLQVTKKFNVTKQSIVEIVKSGYNGNEDDEEGSRDFNLDITDKCRSFISHYDYTEELDPFIEGDAKAKKLTTVGQAITRNDNDNLLSSPSPSKFSFEPTINPTDIVVKEEIEEGKNCDFHDDIGDADPDWESPCSETDEDESSETSESESEKEVESPQNLHTKKKASKKFASKPELTPHAEASTSKILYDKSGLGRHKAKVRGILSARRKWHRCQVEECGKLFYNPSQLMMHMSSYHEKTRQYKCRFCEKGFYRAYHKKRHEETHTKVKMKTQDEGQNDDDPAICDICSKKFYDMSTLRRHKAAVHGFMTTVACPIEGCGETFKGQYSLRSHLFVHENKPQFQCQFCGKDFYARKNVKRHEDRKSCQKGTRCNNSKGRSYDCDICSRKFGRKDRLCNHQRLHHVVSSSENVEELEEANVDLECAQCAFTTKDTVELQLHVKSQHDPPPSAKAKKYFPCPFCATKPDCWRDLISHLKKKHEFMSQEEIDSKLDEFLKCPKCDFRGSIPKDLFFHQRREHKEEESVESLPCGECGILFPSQKLLQTHISTAHKSSTRFICDECGAGFHYPAQLKTHMVRHTSQVKRDYVCDVCGVDFARDYQLIKHHQEYHSEAAESKGQIFKCRYCDLTSPYNAVIRKHLQTHKEQAGNRCHKCGKCFINKQGLKRHLRINHIESGAEQVPCPHCRKLFPSKEYMQIHVKRRCKLIKLDGGGTTK